MSLRNSERVVSDICSSEQMVLFELCEPVSLCDFFETCSLFDRLFALCNFLIFSTFEFFTLFEFFFYFFLIFEKFRISGFGNVFSKKKIPIFTFWNFLETQRCDFFRRNSKALIA